MATKPSVTVWMQVFVIIFFFRKKIPVPWFWQVSETRVEILKLKKCSESRSLTSLSFFRALSCHYDKTSVPLQKHTTSGVSYKINSNFYETLVVMCVGRGIEVRLLAHILSLTVLLSLLNSRRVSCRDISGHLIEAKELLLQLLSVWAQSL